MKNMVLFAVFVLSTQLLSAQVDVKISPIPLLFGVGAVSVEYALAPSWGLDADILAGADFFGANLSGKFYFDPQKGIDRFHVGAFIGDLQGSVGLGFLVGTKIVSKKRILFEIGVGIGRTLDDGVIGYGKLHLGYRLGKGRQGSID